jgi:hypothetical protein
MEPAIYLQHTKQMAQHVHSKKDKKPIKTTNSYFPVAKGNNKESFFIQLIIFEKT